MRHKPPSHVLARRLDLNNSVHDHLMGHYPDRDSALMAAAIKNLREGIDPATTAYYHVVPAAEACIEMELDRRRRGFVARIRRR